MRIFYEPSNDKFRRSRVTGDTEPPNVSVPQITGAGLLWSKIENGVLQLSVVLVNRTSKTILVEFNESHVATLEIEDSEGTIFRLNDHLDPVKTAIISIPVEPNSEQFYTIKIDENQYDELDFSASRNPYTVRLRLNSFTHQVLFTVITEVLESDKEDKTE